MRLVIEFSVGDDCTYSCTATVPVVFDSAEQFLIEFEDAMRQGKKAMLDEVSFAGQDWHPDDFFYNADPEATKPKWIFIVPDILTVDEWFEAHK